METGTIGRDKSVVTGKYLKLATSKCGLYRRPTARQSMLVYLSTTVKHSLNYNHCHKSKWILKQFYFMKIFGKSRWYRNNKAMLVYHDPVCLITVGH